MLRRVQQLSVHLLTNFLKLAQLLGAALVPGNPQANMYFTLYAAHSVGQASHLTSDLKLGQYTKLPPRDTFIVQLVGTVIGAILQLVIMKSIISAQRDILLSVDGTNIWSGQQVQSFNSQAIAVGGAYLPLTSSTDALQLSYGTSTRTASPTL